MFEGHLWKRVIAGSLAIALAGMVYSSPVMAQGDSTREYRDEVPLPLDDWQSPIDPFTVGLGVDVVTQYFFRGYEIEDSGGIFQPWLEVGVNLYEGEGFINSLDAYVGWWNSVHTVSNTLGSDSNWFETDIYFGFEVGFFDYWTFGFEFIDYEYPGLGADAIREVVLGLSFDDSDFLGAFALNPYFFFAIEVDNTMGDELTYFELGIEPGFTLLESHEYPISVSFPIALGLSVNDYYTNVNSGNNEVFGYFAIGATVSVPLSFIPRDFGEWEVSAGVTGLFLNDSVGFVDSGNGTSWGEVYGTFGISMQY